MFQSAKMKWDKGMNDKSKSYSLLQRGEWDVQMFKEGAKAKIASPQCETCSNWIKGDVYHCKHYKNEIKPKGVVSAKKECVYYSANNEFKIPISTDQAGIWGIIRILFGDALGVPVEFTTREERKKDPVKGVGPWDSFSAVWYMVG